MKTALRAIGYSAAIAIGFGAMIAGVVGALIGGTYLAEMAGAHWKVAPMYGLAGLGLLGSAIVGTAAALEQRNKERADAAA